MQNEPYKLGLMWLIFFPLGVPLRFATGRHIPGFASLGASHASPLHAAHAILSDLQTSPNPSRRGAFRHGCCSA